MLKWVKSNEPRRRKKEEREILQGLGVGPGSATERWPCRKNVRKSTFFRKKIKNTLKNIIFLDFSFKKVFYKRGFSRDFLAIYGQHSVAEPGLVEFLNPDSLL